MHSRHVVTHKRSEAHLPTSSSHRTGRGLDKGWRSLLEGCGIRADHRQSSCCNAHAMGGGPLFQPHCLQPEPPSYGSLVSRENVAGKMAALAIDRTSGPLPTSRQRPRRRRSGSPRQTDARTSPRGVRATFPVGTTDHHHYTRKLCADLDGRRHRARPRRAKHGWTRQHRQQSTTAACISA
jgi:hypothetical protein